MTKFTRHTPESAPEASRQALTDSKRQLGFIPNLFAGLAESPVALKTYLTISDLFGKSRLSPIEQQVVVLAASIENECEYDVAVHSIVATGTVKVPAPIVEALRNGSKLPDAKLDALATFTRIAVRKRGWADETAVKALLDAGYDRAQMLDIVVGISMKTLSNYANHIMRTELDKELESARWSRTRKAA